MLLDEKGMDGEEKDGRSDGKEKEEEMKWIGWRN